MALDLQALAALPAPPALDVIENLERPFEFHLHCRQLGLPAVVGITDDDAIRLIERAIIAELDDPEPIDDRPPLSDDLAREGQWPPSQALPFDNPYGNGA